MPSSNKAVFAALMLLAGCGGGGGYDAAPTIALPRDAAMGEDPVAQRSPLPDAEDAPRVVRPVSDLGPAPTEVEQAAGPRGTSGEAHDDGVGYAAVMPAADGRAAVGATHPTLSPGSFVEITSIDSGRTIVAVVVGGAARAGSFALTPQAAQLLDIREGAPVRVRAVMPSAQDQTALRSGQSASPRLDAPSALLTALRRQLSGARPRAAAVPARPRLERPAAVAEPIAPARRGTLIVQVATLSNRARATELAGSLGGRVVPVGKLFRVQIGPFSDAASAQRARDGAARRGYADARILHAD